MKRKTITFIMIFLLISMSAVTGCSGGNTNNAGNAYADLADIAEQTPHQINETLTKDGKELSIDADVELNSVESLREVTLIRDTDSAERMAAALITSKYKNVTKLSSLEWVATQTASPDSTALAALTLDCNNMWSADYTDVANDINYGQYYGEDAYGNEAYLFKYGYITDIVPRQMDLSPNEASDAVRAYFKDYTELSFQPYRILAADSTTDSTKPGYYTIWLRAVYDNVPICIKSDGCPIGVTALISKAGIVHFQGLFLLKQSAQKGVSKIVTLDSIMAQLKNNFALLSSSPRVDIYHISLEYVEQTNSDGSYTLRPAWCFYGEATPETGEGRSADCIFIFSAEDGTLYDCGDLYSNRGGAQAQWAVNTPANT